MGEREVMEEAGGRVVTSLSLFPRERAALKRLTVLLKRQSMADTIRYLIWSALEQNYPEEYKELKENWMEVAK